MRKQEHGFQFEVAFSRRWGLSLIPGSGCGRRKGDCYSEEHLYQLKATKSTSFRLTTPLFSKTMEEAYQHGLEPRVVICFIGETDVPLLFCRMIDIEAHLENNGELLHLPMTLKRLQATGHKYIYLIDGEGFRWVGIPMMHSLVKTLMQTIGITGAG
jgi:hypothetical protein